MAEQLAAKMQAKPQKDRPQFSNNGEAEIASSSGLSSPPPTPIAPGVENDLDRDDDWEDEEPFDVMEPKIKQLARDLYPHIQSSMEIKVEKLGQGTYNSVYGLTIPAIPAVSREKHQFDSHQFDSHQSNQSVKEFVVRVPTRRVGEEEEVAEEVLREIATLRVIGLRAQFPTPTIIHYSQETSNALGRRYIIQTRLRGRNLHRLWEDLSLAQAASAARQIAKIVEQIVDVSFANGGKCSTLNLDLPSEDLQPIEIEKLGIPEWTEKCPWTPSEEWTTQSPIKWIEEHIHRWIDWEKSQGETDNQEASLDLRKIARALKRDGKLGHDFKLIARRSCASQHHGTHR